VPKYNYILVSKDGVDKITNQHAIQMMAPAGSANMSALTTLVALDTTGTVKKKLEDLMPAGVKFDADISVNTSSAALMVAKSVETIVQAMSSAVTTSATNGSATITPAQVSSMQAQTMQNISEEFAKPATTATTLSAPQNLTTTLQSAATASVASINSGGNITIPAATAKIVAASSVTATTTALNITQATATTTAMTGGETAALASTAVALVAEVKAAVTEAVKTVVAEATPPAYTPPPIQVIPPPAALYIAPPLGTQTIGNISFTPAILNIGSTTTVSAVSTSALTVGFTSATPAVCTVSGTTVSGVTDGMCIISANQSGNGSFSAASRVQSYITIRATQSIGAFIFDPTTLNVGGSTTISASATSGMPVIFNSTTPTVCNISGNKITGLSAGTCTISADQTGNSNYVSAAQKTQNISVSAGSQTITVITPPQRGADAKAPFTVEAVASSGLPVAYSSGSPNICTNSGSTFTMKSAGACVVLFDQAGNANYSAAPQVSNSSTTDLQTQIITTFLANPATLNFGGSTTLSASATSGLPVTFSSSTPDVCSVSGTTVTALKAGICTVAADHTGNGFVDKAPRKTLNLIIATAKQEISVIDSAPATAVVNTSFTVSATATSGLPVTYSSGTPGICSNTGGKFTMLSAGNCIVQYNQGGNTNYTAAEQVVNTTTLTKLKQTIGVITYGPKGGTSTTVSASATSGLPVTFVSSTPNICSISGSTVTTITGGTCVIDASQAGNGLYNAAATSSISMKLTTINATGSTGGSINF